MNKTFNDLLTMARMNLEKRAVVDAQTLQSGGMDPAAMGGGAGMDPAMAGMDPAAMAGAAAPPPPGISREEVTQMIQQAVAAGGGAGGAEPIKPKIDVNVELMQIKKMLARLLDAQGVPMPASEMVATSDDLMQMASEQGGAGAPQGGGGGAAGSAIAPISPIAGASPELAQGKQAASLQDGVPYGSAQSLGSLTSKAAALVKILAARK